MSDFESFHTEVVNALGEFLVPKMASLEEFHDEWPDGHDDLDYPSKSIITVGDTSFTPAINKRIFKITPVDPDDADNAGRTVKWVIGTYDLSLQIDIWAGDKPERGRLYEEFFEAMNSQFTDKNSVLGLSLPMNRYHGIICRYDMTGLKILQDEESAQRKEWRIRANLLAQGRAIKVIEQSAILETELNVETQFTELTEDC